MSLSFDEWWESYHYGKVPYYGETHQIAEKAARAAWEARPTAAPEPEIKWLREKVKEQAIRIGRLRERLFSDDTAAPELKTGLHAWECVSPGMYDDYYKCKNCGVGHMEQADNPAETALPEYGCKTTAAPEPEFHQGDWPPGIDLEDDTAAPEAEIDSLVFAFMAGQMNPDKSPTYSNARIWVEEYLRNAGGGEHG